MRRQLMIKTGRDRSRRRKARGSALTPGLRPACRGGARWRRRLDGLELLDLLGGAVLLEGEHVVGDLVGVARGAEDLLSTLIRIKRSVLRKITAGWHPPT